VNVLLGMLPVGIAEMSLTAEALGLLVPLVTAMRMLRLMRGCSWRGRCSFAGVGAWASDKSPPAPCRLPGIPPVASGLFGQFD